MANKKISELTAGNAVAATDIFPAVETANSGPVKKTAEQIRQYVVGSGVVTVASGKSLNVNNSLTFNGTDNTTFVFPSTDGTVATLNYPNVFTAAQTFGVAGTTSGNITLASGSSSYTTSFVAGNPTANVTYNLPPSDGANGSALVTNGSGTLSWYGSFAKTTNNLSDLNSASTARTNLGLGTAATYNISNSGANVPLLNASNIFSDQTYFTGPTTSINLGSNGGNNGVAVFYGSTSGSVTIKAAAAAGTGTIFQLPASNGTNGYVLSTDGFGALSWVANGGGGGSTPGGSDKNIQFNDTGTMAGSVSFTFDKTTYTATVGKTSTTTGKLAFANASSAFLTTLQAGNATAAVTYTLPTADGTTGQALTTNGSGTLSWSTVPTGTINTATAGQLAYYSGTQAVSGTTTGTGVVTALGVNTGSAGAFVVNGGALGTPSSGTLTNATGLPVSTGVSGLGTSVATALAVNVGSAGAVVVNGGALGAPSSGTLTNVTGLPLTTGVTGTLPVANGGTGVTTSTGSGSNVLSTSPTLVTPILGTPTSGTLTSCTGLPISTGVSGLGNNVATALAVNIGSSGAVLTTNNTNTITIGYAVTPYSISTGSFTVTPANGNYQYVTNNGAYTITNPASDCAVDILVTNGASAGATTFTGFTVASGNTGDPLTTTNTNKFIISVRRINGTSTYVIKALQ